MMSDNVCRLVIKVQRRFFDYDINIDSAFLKLLLLSHFTKPGTTIAIHSY